MTERYRIRGGVSSDLAGVLALDRATELLPHWQESVYTEALQYPGSNEAKTGLKRCLFVAEKQSRIVGFVVASITLLPTEVLAALESVAVAVPERRLGIGRALCQSAIEWSRRNGTSEMDLEVRSASQAAITLYSRLGFTVMGKRDDYYRDPLDDAVLMRMRLQKA